MESTQIISLADGLTTTGVSFRARSADESILPAEVWCPIFAFYGGSTSPKFNDSQIETLAKQGVDNGWCNLCDAPMPAERDAHVQQHMTQLATWRRQRGAQIERDRSERAREARGAKRDAA